MPPPTKDELQRDLERERQRAWMLVIQQQTQAIAGLKGEIGALKAASDAKTAAENARMELEKQRPVRRMVDGFLRSDWKGKLAYLSPLIACLLFGYALAAGVSPATVTADLLHTVGLCTSGVPNARSPDLASPASPDPNAIGGP